MLYTLTLVISLMFYHPLHLGVIHIDVAQNNESHISVKVFTDDLENAIMQKSAGTFKIQFSDPVSIERASRYVINHFKVRQSEVDVELKLNHAKRESDVSVFVYSATIQSEEPFEVCCNIFYELFSDQTNLLIVNLIDDEDGYRLSSRKTCAYVE